MTTTTVVTSIIIVTEDDDEYGYPARQMAHLIGLRHPNLDIACWTEKQYEHNEAQLSTLQPVIFLGPSDPADPYKALLPIAWEERNLYIALSGRRAMIKARGKFDLDEFARNGKKHSPLTEAMARVREIDDNLANVMQRSWRRYHKDNEDHEDECILELAYPCAVFIDRFLSGFVGADPEPKLVL